MIFLRKADHNTLILLFIYGKKRFKEKKNYNERKELLFTFPSDTAVCHISVECLACIISFALIVTWKNQ